MDDEARITVDVNQAWDEDTANYCIAALEDGGVSMVEQPLPTWNLEGMSRLTAKFKVPIMADEAANSIQDVFHIAKHRAGNCIALKPCKAGGLTQTKKVAGIAEAAGIGLYGGTMIESSLGTAICAQLYATIPEMKFGTEIFGPLLFKDDLTLEPIKFENFEVIIPNGPGFGVEIDRRKSETLCEKCLRWRLEMENVVIVDAVRTAIGKLFATESRGNLDELMSLANRTYAVPVISVFRLPGLDQTLCGYRHRRAVHGRRRPAAGAGQHIAPARRERIRT